MLGIVDRISLKGEMEMEERGTRDRGSWEISQKVIYHDKNEMLKSLKGGTTFHKS